MLLVLTGLNQLSATFVSDFDGIPLFSHEECSVLTQGNHLLVVIGADDDAVGVLLKWQICYVSVSLCISSSETLSGNRTIAEVLVFRVVAAVMHWAEIPASGWFGSTLKHNMLLILLHCPPLDVVTRSLFPFELTGITVWWYKGGHCVPASGMQVVNCLM